MEYVPRLAESAFQDYLKSPKQSILLVTGAPQVGKTRLIDRIVEQAGPPRISFSLKHHPHFLEQIEACSTFTQFRKLMENEYRFDPKQESMLCIDDIQESARLADFIPRMADAWPGCPVIMCGSRLPEAYAPLLEQPNQLITHCTIHPYQFSEFLAAHQKKSLARHVEHGKTSIFEDRHHRLTEWLERFLEVGGLPEVVDWASHGEDFEFHLGEVISGILKSIESTDDDVRGSIENILSPSIEGLGGDLLKDLKRWDLVVHTCSPHGHTYLFDVGISRQFKQLEAPSFSDCASGDPGALTRLTDSLIHQTALSLNVQHAVLAPHDQGPATADFCATIDGVKVPIFCQALFETTPEAIETGFQELEKADADLGVIIALTPFEATTREGKQLLFVPLYLVEALSDIITRTISSA